MKGGGQCEAHELILSSNATSKYDFPLPLFPSGPAPKTLLVQRSQYPIAPELLTRIRPPRDPTRWALTSSKYWPITLLFGVIAPLIHVFSAIYRDHNSIYDDGRGLLQAPLLHIISSHIIDQRCHP